MIEQLPLTTRALIAVAVVCIVAIGGYVGLIAPKRRAIARLERQLTPAPPAPAVERVVPISDAERAEWRLIDARARERFAAPADQHRTLVEVGRLARSKGLRVTDLLLQNAAVATPGSAAPAAALPLPMPPHLGANSGIIRVVARHQFRNLIDFLDDIGRGKTYVALQSLDVRRIDDHLESEIRLISLRWAE